MRRESVLATVLIPLAVGHSCHSPIKINNSKRQSRCIFVVRIAHGSRRRCENGSATLGPPVVVLVMVVHTLLWLEEMTEISDELLQKQWEPNERAVRESVMVMGGH